MIRRVDASGVFGAVVVSFFQVDIANKTIAAGIKKATSRIIIMARAMFQIMIVAFYTRNRIQNQFAQMSVRATRKQRRQSIYQV